MEPIVVWNAISRHRENYSGRNSAVQALSIGQYRVEKFAARNHLVGSQKMGFDGLGSCVGHSVHHTGPAGAGGRGFGFLVISVERSFTPIKTFA